MSYRCEDKTLEMIRARAQAFNEKFPDNAENANWNAACFELIDEMKHEGLNTTASEIAGWIVQEPQPAVSEINH